MSDTPRYALYLAPEPGTWLWQAGSSLLGYDAATGHDLAFPAPFATDEHWTALTEDPRRYGFHMTLKAPFRLSQGVKIEDLEDGLTAFSGKERGFSAGPLALECRMKDDNEGFVCLVPREPSKALSALEAATVPTFESFRAPLSDAELARRKPESLPPRERAYLEAFGYPHVLGAFRPHFSLTGMHTDPEATRRQLEAFFADAPGALHFECQAILLFEQPSPRHRFHLRRTYPLST